MSDLRKAAQQALEALDSDHPDIQLRAAITLREALAQPDPVAAEREACIALLEGIDQTENGSDVGWWETSTGARFGAGILAAIRARGKHE